MKARNLEARALVSLARSADGASRPKTAPVASKIETLLLVPPHFDSPSSSDASDMSTSAGSMPTVAVLNASEERQIEAQTATRRGSTPESIATLQEAVEQNGKDDCKEDTDKVPAIPTHHANGLVDQTSYMCAQSRASSPLPPPRKPLIACVHTGRSSRS